MARLRAVPVTIDLWQIIMAEGYKGSIHCVEGLPEGAKLVNSYHDGAMGSVFLVFHHPSFSHVPEGGMVERIVPIFESLTE